MNKRMKVVARVNVKKKKTNLVFTGAALHVIAADILFDIAFALRAQLGVGSLFPFLCFYIDLAGLPERLFVLVARAAFMPVLAAMIAILVLTLLAAYVRRECRADVPFATPVFR